MKLLKILDFSKKKLGPLWWYSLIIFCAQRLSDVLNILAGLWLVPKYVPEAELGAVQPLTQIGAFLGLPLAIFVTPFIKLLNNHATNNELGKVKSLLRDAIVISVLILVIVMVAAKLFLPSLLEFMRIEDGRLTLAIVFASLLATLVPIFTGALQALKRFRLYTVSNLLAAPIRFATFLLVLPIRGLTGYFVGQSVPSFLTIGLTISDFFRKFGKNVKCKPYFKEDLPIILMYIVPLSLIALTGNLRGSLEMLLLRSLPDAHSAAHYHITRFSEIATYIVNPMIFVMFPLIAEKSELGDSTYRIMAQTTIFTLGSGLLFSVVLAIFGPTIFSLREIWQGYSSFTGLFGIATVTATLRMASTCITTHHIACGRFRYAFYLIPIYILEAVFFYLLLRKPDLMGIKIDSLEKFFQLIFIFSLIRLSVLAVDAVFAVRNEIKH
ncbi:MAG: hypothetical protein GX804_07240 [Lentisphaerae bacterium]|nr:hypothetical protein [Lentisphaerota bacterium]